MQDTVLDKEVVIQQALQRIFYVPDRLGQGMGDIHRYTVLSAEGGGGSECTHKTSK